MKTTKAWYKSKGLWLGIITALVGSLDIITEILQSDTMSMEGLAVAGLGILKIWERFARNDLTLS